MNQSNEVTRESTCAGTSRPSVVSHSVKPNATQTPASTWKAAITSVLPAPAMIAGWQAAPMKAAAHSRIGRFGCARSPSAPPMIEPTANAVTIAAQLDAPDSSRSATTGPSASTHGSAIRW